METISEAGCAIFAIIAIVLVIAALAFGSWHLGWFINKADTNKQSEIYNDSFQRQNALVAEAGRTISEVKAIDVQITTATPEGKQALVAQRKAIVTQACETIGKFSGTVSVPESTTAFGTKECS